MLKKLISIKNVGRFSNAAASGDVEFAKVSIMFAENGRGKTTLCAILRSLQTGEGRYVQGRQTLGQNDAPEIDILLTDGNARLRDGQWSRTLPNIDVFDSHFVAQNVYSGDLVGTDHKRNLYRVIVGREGVKLAEQVDAAAAAGREQARVVQQGKLQVEHRLPEGIGLDEFMALHEDIQIEAKIESKARELATAQQADAIARRPGLAPLPLPALPENLMNVLGKTLEGMSEEVEQKIAAHVAAHGMGERGEAWLSEGLGYATGDDCPFCGRGDLNDIDLVAAYRVYFGEAYHGLRGEVETIGDKLEEDWGDGKLMLLEHTATQNTHAAEFWKDFSAFDVPSAETLTGGVSVLEALRARVWELITLQEHSPLERIEPGQEFKAALEPYQALAASVTAYNEAATKANEVIDAKKQEADVADVRQLEQELQGLQAVQKRWEAETRAACQAYVDATSEKDRLERDREAAKAQLDEYSEKVMGQYQRRINDYLKKFTAGFGIRRTRHTYPAGRPSTSYQIFINETAVPLGDANTPVEQPSFGNTLSSGDRSTLALAFFLAQLDEAPNKQNRIVVLDDPFNSQDDCRKGQTIYRIKKCGQECAQVVVLSHDRTFLGEVWNELDAGERKSMELIRLGEKNSRIVPWDVEEAVTARFELERQKIQRYHSDCDGNALDVIKCLRPCVETWVRKGCPGEFTSDDNLGSILGRIRATGDSHALQEQYEEMDQINAYSTRYHHGEDPAVLTEDPINDTELQGYCGIALSLVGNS